LLLSAERAAADRDRDDDRAVLQAVAGLQASVSTLQTSVNGVKTAVAALAPPVQPNARATAPLVVNGNLEGVELSVVNIDSVPHNITWGVFTQTGQAALFTDTIAPGASLRSNTAVTGEGVFHARFIVNDGTREDIRGSFVVRRSADSVITAVLSAD
jgi:hypothetical protein